MASPRGCVAADRHPGPLHSEQTPPPLFPTAPYRNPNAAGRRDTCEARERGRRPRQERCKRNGKHTLRGQRNAKRRFRGPRAAPVELARVRGQRAWAPAGDRGGPSRAQRPGRCPEKPFGTRTGNAPGFRQKSRSTTLCQGSGHASADEGFRTKYTF